MNEDLKLVAGLITAVAILLAVAMINLRAMFAWECNVYGRTTGLETRMEALTCYIKGQDRWYAWAESKLRGATKGN